MFRNVICGVGCGMTLFCGIAGAMMNGRVPSETAPMSHEGTLRIRDLMPEERFFIIPGIVTDGNKNMESQACELARKLYSENYSWLTKYMQCKKVFGMPKFVDADMFSDMKDSFLSSEISDVEKLHILLSMRSYIQMDELSTQFIKPEDTETCVSVYKELFLMEMRSEA